MIKEIWKSYRITWLLYAAILVLPLAFSLSIGQLRTFETDTQAIRLLGQTGGDMLSYTVTTDPRKEARYRTLIPRELHKLSLWFQGLNQSRYYIGPHTPAKDFSLLQKCWTQLEKSRSPKQGLACRERARSLAFSVERMIALELDHLRNILYLTLAGSIIFLLLMIFFIRAYIQHQLLKHAVTDVETGLFNRKYCEVSLHKHCARAQRLGHALSLLDIHVEGIDPKWKKEEKRRFMMQLGKTLHELFRASDTLCRYDENGFVAIMPDTPPEGARIVESRVREKLGTAMREYFPSFQSSVEILTSPKEGSCEQYLRQKLGLGEAAEE